MKSQNVVCLFHGKEGGPSSTKITKLATVAESCGFEIVIPDFRYVDDPDERVRRVLAEAVSSTSNLVLVGSSMGGYVAAVTGEVLAPDGLLLLAPALYRSGYANQTPQPDCAHIEVVHGWRDEVIPVEGSLRFARERKAELHLVDSDHRLHDRLELIEIILRRMLTKLIAARK